MSAPDLSVILADDERPARRYLATVLKSCTGVTLLGEAASGEEAISLIRAHKPQLALLDLQMPEIGGLDVVRRLPPEDLPLVAFVTAFDDHAIEAFELNAIDYVLKPVQRDRLQATIDRARDRVQSLDAIEHHRIALASAAQAYDRGGGKYADRLPLRDRDKVVIVPARTIASIVAEGEILHVHTTTNEDYTVNHRLLALEARLDPRRFIRLNRGTLVNIDAIAHVSPMPGGTYLATLTTGEELSISRMQSRMLRDTLLKL
jgi:two-component system LytT family response regulator